jgi:hypothetical protein
MRPSNFCKLGNCAVGVRTSNDWRPFLSAARALLGDGSAHGAHRSVNKITAHIALPGMPGTRARSSRPLFYPPDPRRTGRRPPYFKYRTK